ncbi:MAG: hypothetical protein MUD01_12555 [Chloroflexaceae bacterium]|jgi:hypothetical protein|nr:hypothetical protein [Chloroflexaceae bacterium]
MTETERDPSEQEWRALYQAADAFKALAPWEWMFDDDLFAVQDPETGEIGYCCVMGNLGEMFAMALYLGNEGLQSYLLVQSGVFGDEPLGAMFVQRCLMASFEDRDGLDQRDRDQIKSLGLKYRGRAAWPLFRDYTPGLFPWYLTAPQVRFLTLALQQVCEVAPRLQENEEAFTPPNDNQVLLRSLENGTWRDSWYTPDLTPPPSPALPPVNEVQLQRLKKANLRRAGVWESDILFYPGAVQETRTERPYYPHLCLTIDQQSGMILQPTMTGQTHWQREYQDGLLALLEQNGVKPAEIQVRSSEAQHLLTPITESLGIKLRMVEELPGVDEAYDSMMEFVGRGMM